MHFANRFFRFKLGSVGVNPLFITMRYVSKCHLTNISPSKLLSLCLNIFKFKHKRLFVLWHYLEKSLLKKAFPLYGKHVDSISIDDSLFQYLDSSWLKIDTDGFVRVTEYRMVLTLYIHISVDQFPLCQVFSLFCKKYEWQFLCHQHLCCMAYRDCFVPLFCSIGVICHHTLYSAQYLKNHFSD